ncbi:MAG: fluoride efflux transporter CrcB [Phycisphaerales bacterium]|nr:fluoride efflux transporter CrcB [Phycisphaerales bacterium]
MLYVALGGSIGAVLRYLIANLGQSMTTTSFPLGTLVVNVLGCAAIGLITAIVIGPFAQHKEVLRLFLIVGVLGGFTTFSSFAFDALELVDDGRSSQALIYILLTNVLGIGFALFMYRGASLLFNGTSS